MAIIEVEAKEAYRSVSGSGKILEMGIKDVIRGEDKTSTVAYILLDDGYDAIEWRTVDYQGKSVIYDDNGNFNIKCSPTKQSWGQAIYFFQKLKLKSRIDLDPESYLWEVVSNDPKNPVDVIGKTLFYEIKPQAPKKVIDEATGKVSFIPNPYNDIILTGLEANAVQEKKEEKVAATGRIEAWKEFLSEELKEPMTSSEINSKVISWQNQPEKAKQVQLLKDRQKYLQLLVASGFLNLDEVSNKYSIP